MNTDFFRKRERVQRIADGSNQFCEYPNSSFYKVEDSHGLHDCSHTLSVSRGRLESELFRRPISEYFCSFYSHGEPVGSDDVPNQNTSRTLLDLDPLQSQLYFIHGRSGSGKTRLVYETAAAHSMSVICIHPEDFIYNRQIFATTAAKLAGGRTRGDYFERRRVSHEVYIVLIDELEAALETENSAFMTFLMAFISNLSFGVSIAMTSTMPIGSFPELLRTNLTLHVLKTDKESQYSTLSMVKGTYSTRFGRLLDEFELHHLYNRERANKDFFHSVVAGKRKCGDRSQRPLPSIYPDISPLVRDDLLSLFEQRNKVR